MEAKMDAKAKTISYVIGFALAAAMACYVFVARSQRAARIDTLTTSATGVVERVETRQYPARLGGVRTHTYYVSFTDADGQHHEVRSLATGKGEQTHAEGDEVTVRYDADRADDACVIEGDESLV